LILWILALVSGFTLIEVMVVIALVATVFAVAAVHLQGVGESARLKKDGGLDGFALCSDYCLNTGPFLSPDQFSEFVTPFLVKLVRGYRDLGFYTIKHTDGNIMPIVGQLVDARPHALHSLDPQAGVDMAVMKKRFGGRVCLIGNVNCGKLDTGTDAEVVESARYALRNGMPGGGYIFSTSNCIYTGMRLSRYELMLDIWRREGNYGSEKPAGKPPKRR
jgi:uroporphyrinogen decarboxylase